MSSVLSVHLCVYVPKKHQYINSISIHLSIISVYIKPTQKTVVNLFKLPFWNYSAIMQQHIQCLTLAHKTIGLIHSEFSSQIRYPVQAIRYHISSHRPPTLYLFPDIAGLVASIQFCKYTKLVCISHILTVCFVT